MFGVDDGSRIAFATDAFADRLGTTPNYLTGTPLDIVVAGRDGTDPLAVVETLRSATEGTSQQCPVYLRGEDRPLAATVEFTATGDRRVVGTVHEQPASAERFRHLFEQSHEAMVSFELVELEPVVRSVNTAFVETFGYDPDEIVGESLNEFIVPEDHIEEATDYDRQTADGARNHGVVTRRTVNGRREFVYRGLSYTTDSGRRYGFAIYTDVTDDRRRRRRLQVLHRVLRHNLRNDLSVVVGMADHVRETAADPELQRAADGILTAAERLSSVSEQARDVEVALESDSDRAVDAAKIARSVAADYPAADVRTDTPDTAAVTGGMALYDAVDNLVENAVEHTPEGTEVWVTVGEEHGETYVRVSDDGLGIPPIERAAVFEDEDITTLKHGSGLGLWLARWVAEAAGGECRYDRFDDWTVVTLWLPTADASEREVLTPYQASHERGSSD